MARQARGVRIALGIYREPSGAHGVIAYGGGRRRETSFDADADLREMQRWQAETRAELLEPGAGGQALEPATRSRSTYASDLPRYLKRIDGRPSFKADRAHLRAWLPRIGPLLRRKVKTSHVDEAIGAWRLAGVKDWTIRHRCRVLRDLWHTLDGKKKATPVDDAKVPKKPKVHPVGVPAPTIQKVITRLTQNLAARAHWKRANRGEKTLARFLVLATTGQRPATLRRARPEHVTLKKTSGLWMTVPTKGGEFVPITLNGDMVDAWRLFIQYNAWATAREKWNEHNYRRAVRAAGWPKGVSTYNTRHSVAIDAIARGADLGDVQGLLGHLHIDTTRTTYGPLVRARQQHATQQLAGRLTVPQATTAHPLVKTPPSKVVKGRKA